MWETFVVAVALYTDGSPNEGDAEDFDFAMMVTATARYLADTRNKAPCVRGPG